jgi:hypothetical protein
MGKMTPEKAVKMLSEEGLAVTIEEATRIVEFLRTLAKMTVAQYLREDEQTPHQDTDDNQETQ